MENRIETKNLVSLVEVLGTGSAFRPENTNTSFLLLNGKILVDCGYNVFQKLMSDYKKQLDEELRYVFVTHGHDDHIGSLQTLIYYNEFIRKSPLTVYLPYSVFVYNFYNFIRNGKLDPATNATTPFEYTDFKILIHEVINRKKQGEELDRVNDFREIMETIPKRLIGDDDDNAYILGKSSLDVTVNDKGIVMGNNNDKSLITSNNRDIKFRVYTKYITRPNHGNWLNTSYIFHIIIDDENINKKNNVLIGISGDMRADKVFETYFNIEYNTILDHSNAKVYPVVFHDFSHAEYPGCIHATQHQFDHIYSEEFQKWIVKVHHDEPPTFDQLQFSLESRNFLIFKNLHDEYNKRNKDESCDLDNEMCVAKVIS